MQITWLSDRRSSTEDVREGRGFTSKEGEPVEHRDKDVPGYSPARGSRGRRQGRSPERSPGEESRGGGRAQSKTERPAASGPRRPKEKGERTRANVTVSGPDGACGASEFRKDREQDVRVVARQVATGSKRAPPGQVRPKRDSGTSPQAARAPARHLLSTGQQACPTPQV